MALLNSRFKSHVQLQVSQSVRLSFEIYHVTIIETRVSLLTSVRSIDMSYVLCTSNVHTDSFVIYASLRESEEFFFF